MVKLDKAATLRLLGLSPLQVRVFLALVKLGKSDAKTLAQHSNVSCSLINKMLDDFQNLGLVQKTFSNPSIFKANPLEQSFSKMVSQEVKHEILENKNLVDDLKQEQLDFDMTLIPTTEMAIQKRSELVQKADVSIDVISSWQHYRFLLRSNFNLLTENAVERNVKYRLMVETPKNVKLPPEHLAALKILDKNCSEFRYIPVGSSALMTLYDKRDVLMLTAPKARPYGSSMLWSNNASIVLMSQNYFDNLWLMASEKPY